MIAEKKPKWEFLCEFTRSKFALRKNQSHAEKFCLRKFTAAFLKEINFRTD